MNRHWDPQGRAMSAGKGLRDGRIVTVFEMRIQKLRIRAPRKGSAQSLRTRATLKGYAQGLRTRAT